MRVWQERAARRADERARLGAVSASPSPAGRAAASAAEGPGAWLVFRHLRRDRAAADARLHTGRFRRPSLQRGWRPRPHLWLADADPGRRLSLAGLAAPEALSSWQD